MKKILYLIAIVYIFIGSLSGVSIQKAQAAYCANGTNSYSGFRGGNVYVPPQTPNANECRDACSALYSPSTNGLWFFWPGGDNGNGTCYCNQGGNLTTGGSNPGGYCPAGWTGDPQPVNGECGPSHNRCNAGSSVNISEDANSWTWDCYGNGGTNASCSETKPSSQPVNGQCGTTHYSCNAGSSVNNVSGSSSYTWNCNGSNGGANASCSEPKTSSSTAPSAPQGFSATSAGTSQIDLFWSPPLDDGGSPVDSYQLYRGTSSGAETLLTSFTSAASHYSDNGLTTNTTYYYKLRARNRNGAEGPFSTASATTTSSQAQTCTDPDATNNGGPLPCTYPAQQTCRADQEGTPPNNCHCPAGERESGGQCTAVCGPNQTGTPPNCVNTTPSTGIVQCGPGYYDSNGKPVKCDKDQFYGLISRLFKFFVFISGLLVVLAVGIGGLFMLISAGSEEKLSYGKRTIKAAIIGFIVVLTAWVIVNTVITVFTDCQGSWYVFEDFKCS